MATLHLLCQSPFTHNQLSSCLRFLAEGDGLLLSGNAVYALQPETSIYATLRALHDSIGLFVLEEDLTARAFTVSFRFKSIDYLGFVELCTHYARVNSWL